mmetsp:Transcript_19482/g.35293  ORF Transcript_19482/g.35293 Transcript_19482/m.35293 type:complete len:88 (-) Transcript_19482:459-722(-)
MTKGRRTTQKARVNRPTRTNSLQNQPPIPVSTIISLFVEEWKSGNEVIKSVESRRYQVLRVVTKEFQGGKHGKTSVLKLVKLELSEV